MHFIWNFSVAFFSRSQLFYFLLILHSSRIVCVETSKFNASFSRSCFAFFCCSRSSIWRNNILCDFESDVSFWFRYTHSTLSANYLFVRRDRIYWNEYPLTRWILHTLNYCFANKCARSRPASPLWKRRKHNCCVIQRENEETNGKNGVKNKRQHTER